MTLKDWADDGWLKSHQTSREEISNLLPTHTLQHYRSIAALPLILGSGKKADADYLENCRKKRNVVEYDYVGGASTKDAEELIEFVNELGDEVLMWLKAKHP
ncbi:MAG: hypothetical protein AB1659_14010, partial [Thermodesulfobacteriota bacterium]